MVRYALVITLLVASGCSMVAADTDNAPARDEAAEHKHAPRHGGQFGDADDLYHYEVLLQGEQRLIVYVNDDQNAPLDVRTLEARWTLNPDTADAMLGDFTAAEDGAYLWADLPETEGELVHVKVEVIKDENWIGMEFYLEKR